MSQLVEPVMRGGLPAELAGNRHCEAGRRLGFTPVSPPASGSDATPTHLNKTYAAWGQRLYR
ncbi:MAG: hypothetical protein KatS3mg051_1098 [Anaerolineae bacterium]|nr:MAG: hypothetical protein KatS3mg051_1098 [Anaerolineae bacterium]